MNLLKKWDSFFLLILKVLSSILVKKEVLGSRPLSESWAKVSCKIEDDANKKWAQKSQKIAQSEKNE